MNNIVAHIIGLDEIHKKKLIKQLSPNIKIIDLDAIQQSIYNHTDILKQKIIWAQLGKDILMHRKQKLLIGSKKIKTANLDNVIKKIITKRNVIKKKIHSLWKIKFSQSVDTAMSKNKKYHLLFIGFNIFPKDYRIKLNLPINPLLVELDKKKFSNKIIFETKPTTYAANQIKYYLNTYSEKIIKGTFPLNLLKTEYLANKYEKFIAYYDRQKYVFVPDNKLLLVVEALNKQLNFISKNQNKNVYIATLFRNGQYIPVDTNRPIQGYYTRDDAVSAMKTKINKPTPIYVYQVRANEFSLLGEKLIATHQLKQHNEELLLLSP